MRVVPSQNAPPPQREDPSQVADGGHIGVATTSYGIAGARLLEMGYLPLPIIPRQKNPAPSRWTTLPINAAQVDAWSLQYPGHGIGLRTGSLVGIDIDVLDADRAHALQALAFAQFGCTLIRVGRWPKRLLLYRTLRPFAKLQVPGVEILGQGQQFVAFGIHPDTGQPYDWPLGETPLDVALDALPLVDRDGIEAYLAAAQALLPPPPTGARSPGKGKAATGMPGAAPVRDAVGRVIDHRDAWLSTIAYHAVQDALDVGGAADAVALAAQVWARFAATTDLVRGKQDGARAYAPADAQRKVADKLRLAASGHLPPRVLPAAEPVLVEPGLPVPEARAALDAVLVQACDQIHDWHVTGRFVPDGDVPDGAIRAPRIGVRATVGLGKTAQSRRHLLALGAKLKKAGLPHGIVVFTPSHVLAEESAAAWRAGGVTVAVHRGFEAQHPEQKGPMCRDLDMVRMALAAGQSAFANSCLRKGGSRCHAFDGCLKQENLDEVGRADVVIAPYDTLFSGLAVKADDVAVLMIDEGCWPRALRETRGMFVETLAAAEVDLPQKGDDAQAEADAWAQLFALRQRIAQALAANGLGSFARTRLVDAGLTSTDCLSAAVLEAQLRPDPELRPGLPQGARKQAAVMAQAAERAIRRERLFLAMCDLLRGDVERNGRIRVMSADAKTGLHEVVVLDLHRLHPGFAAKPVLHLDATLRPELAETVLPGLQVSAITAEAPHMSLTAVQGSFGKATLCADPLAATSENQRRANRLQECVDHVRWEARRVAPGRVLVVTYMACEAAFLGLPGVDVVHFNAIAGLDAYRDVALLIVIGRPLPPDMALQPLVGGYFGQEAEGGYTQVLRSVPLRNGRQGVLRVMQHEDPQAEILRVAICDDEVIQAIGRGRGVNRTADSPLEVQVLADVALPLVHDRVIAWETICPDIVQRMLLAGVAVDSPADAAVLYPALFSHPEQAKTAFRRGGFKGQNPISYIYREMTLKSARYSRGGRGHGLQTAYWLEGDAAIIRATVEQALGPLAVWDVSC